jgi:predicted transcriptional regulator
MSTDDLHDDDDGDQPAIPERIEEEAGTAVSEFDDGLVDLLSWVLDTETRARIYVELRESPWSTSDEIADGTGLYPSTVREALAALHEEGIVERRKRQAPGAGNNPYEYTAIAPSDLVGTIVEEVQSELNTVFNLDTYLGGEEPTVDPVHITVQSEGDAEVAGSTDGTESAESDD